VTALRYGLIGCGMMGKGHVRSLALCDDVEIVALADSYQPSLTSALEALGRDAPTYADHSEMLAQEDLDACVVATPNHTHAAIVCDVLASGRDVLSEKPMATTVDDASRIFEAVRSSDRLYQIGLELRYEPYQQRTRDLIAAGSVGRVRQLWVKEFRGPWMRKVEDWITQKSRSGGALLEKDCHHFDLFNWFAGARPVKVAGFGTVDLVYGEETFSVTPDVLDNAQVVVQYDSGAVATLMLNMYCLHYPEGLELGVIGTEGHLQSSASAKSITLAERASGEQTTVNCTTPEAVRRQSHGGAVYYEHLAFAEAVRSREKPLADELVGWWSTVVGLAAERAVAEERVVEIAEFGTSPARPGPET